MTVSDTSPLCYLLLIGAVEVLPRLFENIAIPNAVCDELTDHASPDRVREWAERPPDWLRVMSVEASNARIAGLGEGETQAILLAEQLNAPLLVLDDLPARRVAAKRGIRITGLLGVLRMAGRRGLLDVPACGNGNGRLRPRLIAASEPREPVTLPADASGELQFRPVEARPDSRLWNELIQRYHYLVELAEF